MQDIWCLMHPRAFARARSQCSRAAAAQGFQRVGIGNVVAVVLMVRKARRSARWLSACRLGEACTLAWRMDGVGVDVDCGARMAQRGSHIAQPASVGRTGESSVDGQAVRKARGKLVAGCAMCVPACVLCHRSMGGRYRQQAFALWAVLLLSAGYAARRGAVAWLRARGWVSNARGSLGHGMSHACVGV